MIDSRVAIIVKKKKKKKPKQQKPNQNGKRNDHDDVAMHSLSGKGKAASEQSQANRLCEECIIQPVTLITRS